MILLNEVGAVVLHGSANLFHIFTVLSKSDKWGIKDENTYKKAA